jgi:hypothetical protein
MAGLSLGLRSRTIDPEAVKIKLEGGSDQRKGIPGGFVLPPKKDGGVHMTNTAEFVLGLIGARKRRKSRFRIEVATGSNSVALVALSKQSINNQIKPYPFLINDAGILAENEE